jgi:hypothetical protein
MQKVLPPATGVLLIAGCSKDIAPTEPAKSPTPLIAAVSALSQQATVDQVAPSDPVVRVTDKTGQPLSGISVVFSIGTSTINTVVTGADGLASTAWKLSPLAGPQTMTATIYSAALTPIAGVTFLTTALADTLTGFTPSTIVNQAGLLSQPVGIDPTVVAVDEFSNPKSGIDVTFEATGGGSVTPTHLATDVGGRATVSLWTLGPGVGVDTLIARVGNLPPIYFTARVGPPFAAKAIVSGERNACAISLDGDVYCWGNNDHGQVNPRDPSAMFKAPQRVPLPAKAVSIAGGYAHTCAISNESPPQAYCWGSNDNEQLGGPAGRAAEPFRVPVPDGLASVTTGLWHSCGLTPAGVAYCWGAGTYGQLGTGELSSCSTYSNGAGNSDCNGPQLVAGNLRFVAIAAGVSHTCAITALGQMYCWGLNSAGQLGAPSGSPCYDYSYDYYSSYAAQPVACALAPQLVPGAPAYTAVAAGSTTCALTPSGFVSCYGAQPGSPSILSGEKFTSLASDANCGIRTDSSVYCWSSTFDAVYASLVNPVQIGSGFEFSAITPTQGHRCGIRQDSGIVLCWGANDAGQLGSGTVSRATAPSFVLPPSTP